MSTAARNSNGQPSRRSTIRDLNKDEKEMDFIKMLKMKLQSHTNEIQYIPYDFSKQKLNKCKLNYLSIPPEKQEKYQPTSTPNLPDPSQKWMEKVVEKIV